MKDYAVARRRMVREQLADAGISDRRVLAAMEEVSGPIVATTLVLLSVFILSLNRISDICLMEVRGLLNSWETVLIKSDFIFDNKSSLFII